MAFFYTQDKRLSGSVWELFQKKPQISLYLQDVSLGYSGRKYGCPGAAPRKISTYSIYFPRLVFVILCGHLIEQVILQEGFKYMGNPEYKLLCQAPNLNSSFHFPSVTHTCKSRHFPQGSYPKQAFATQITQERNQPIWACLVELQFSNQIVHWLEELT